MRTCIILQLAALSVITLLAASSDGLFFHYPRNALVDFFQSLYRKKEAKKLSQNIHHYHLHYYPVYTRVYPVKAPTKFYLDKLHSNNLETLGWSENESKGVPEPEIYPTFPLRDPWPEPTDARSSIWDEQFPHYPGEASEVEELPTAGIIVKVPVEHKIVIERPTVEIEKPSTNPFVSFFQGFKRIKSTLFDKKDAVHDRTDAARIEKADEKLSAYVVYVKPEFGRKL